MLDFRIKRLEMENEDLKRQLRELEARLVEHGRCYLKIAALEETLADIKKVVNG